MTAGIIDLVPGPLGKGELDGALRQAILERLPRTSFLPPALEHEDDSELPESLRPRDAEVVESAGADTVRVLAEVLPTLLPAGLERRAELRTLGSPGCRSPTRSTGWPVWRSPPTGGGGCTTASPGSTPTGCRGCRCRWPTAGRRSGPGRCCCPARRPPGSTPRRWPGSG
ncbi:hypothetical protein SHKM778_89180 [Streptomyces sp. KM77-8]|uniref:Uncharacterized protein n=1 Tax=Streptomyces haneummycinicus TaxID=3074435 RepID=A0AAT9HYU1_9ACTN